jgi:hypothetical protein
MTTSLIITGIVAYLLLGGIMAYKQKRAWMNNPNTSWDTDGFEIFAFALAPVWLIVAFIRQVFVEDWK